MSRNKWIVLVLALIIGAIAISACSRATPTPEVIEKTVVVTQVVEKTVEVPQTVVVTKEVEKVVEVTPTPISNQFIGSGQLDGNGIPANFFSDIHVRKAFNYCFDWDTYINEVLNGEAVQNIGPLIPGMLGYDPNGPHYSYDPDKCAEEFKQAWDGKLWDTGFRMQIAYNTGNDTRRIIAEILQQNIADVNDKFQIEIIALPWPTFLRNIRSGKLPLFVSGWLEDIHDPHNWAQPFMIGTYAHRQNLPDDMIAKFKELVDKGVAETDPAKRAEIYKKLGQLDYENAIAIRGAVATGRHYEQKWVQGWYYNPIYPGNYYYALSKADDAKDPGTMVVASFGDPETLDPALDYETAGAEIIDNTYETLVFYEKNDPTKFIPQLAESWDISDDGSTYTFHIRKGVKFHNGDELTPEDVAYSFRRGLLQGGSDSPQWLLAEPFFGIGTYDIAELVNPDVEDDPAALQKEDPAKLQDACQKVMDAITFDNDAGTVTMHLAQPWGPFLATIAQSWGSIMDKNWVAENGGWDGTCDTWTKYYAITSEDDPFSKIENGTGPFVLDHWTPGEEVALKRFDGYWRTDPAWEGGPAGPAKLENVIIKNVSEWGTRFAMMQAGDADMAAVPRQNVAQVDPLVGELCEYNLDSKDFTCNPTDNPDGALRLFKGQPGVARTDAMFNFQVK